MFEIMLLSKYLLIIYYVISIVERYSEKDEKIVTLYFGVYIVVK